MARRGARTISLPALLLPMLSLAWTGCDSWPGRPNPKDEPVPSELRTDFGFLYKENCAGCHGQEGTLGAAPPLNDPIYLALVSDADVLKVIAEGRPGTLMPAFGEKHGGTLSVDQVKSLAKGIKEKWATAPKAAETPSYLAADRAVGSKERGAEVFVRSCARCHGNDGKGKSAGAINEPAFLRLVSDDVLRRIIVTGRSDLDMPGFAEQSDHGVTLKKAHTTRDVGDLVALLAFWREAGSPGQK